MFLMGYQVHAKYWGTYCKMFESHTRVNISQQHMTCTLPYLAQNKNMWLPLKYWLSMWVQPTIRQPMVSPMLPSKLVVYLGRGCKSCIIYTSSLSTTSCAIKPNLLFVEAVCMHVIQSSLIFDTQKSILFSAFTCNCIPTCRVRNCWCNSHHCFL